MYAFSVTAASNQFELPFERQRVVLCTAQGVSPSTGISRFGTRLAPDLRTDLADASRASSVTARDLHRSADKRRAGHTTTYVQCARTTRRAQCLSRRRSKLPSAQHIAMLSEHHPRLLQVIQRFVMVHFHSASIELLLLVDTLHSLSVEDSP